MSQEPVNIMGVMAFPNENGVRDIRFIDSDYHTLFTVPDGGNIIVTPFDGREELLACRYIDDAHAKIGGNVYHICQFAELQERAGSLYAPESPQDGDICDSYTIYQLQNVGETVYAFRSYAEAEGLLHREDYKKVYAGVLAPEVHLEELYAKHNRAQRPFGQKMHALSMSDIIVCKRGGTERAYYVDAAGFEEVKEFCQPKTPQREKKKPPRNRGGESR